ncbi:MAG: DEAD/DEAH box helicase [Rickettsiales bacterium]|nr:DEAD/DEAH box helicase [Rickettsiales bacterium]
MPSFSKLNLNPKILSALEAKGYTTPTPIQFQAIPPLLEGRDILGIAQTGTGKTAAFSLPILHNLAKSDVAVKNNSVRTLILTPTRELASQIAENIEAYGKDLGLRYAVIFGGVSERPQIATMQRGVDILIATPGRLLDLMTQGHIRYAQLEILVLDEADRMLDMGFINDVKKIIAKVPENRQTLFFSATMPDTIADLANSILKNPVTVEITPQSTTVERIEQKLNFVEKSNKLSLLKSILKQEDATSVLVFSKTKHGANRIVEFLEKNAITVAAIHGNKSQGAREKALSSFREGKVQVLIATDIAARGIDVPAISHVINYDIPMDPESYVHRIGRTARAGRQGIAISFCDASERKLLQAVEKTIRFKIPVDDTHPFHGVAPRPSSVESSRDEREARSESRSNSRGGGRQYGHSVNKERRISASSSDRPRGDRREGGRSGDSDRRSSAPRGENRGERSSAPRGERSSAPRGDRREGGFGRDNRRSSSDSRPVIDPSKSGLLDFIGLGKKRSYVPQKSVMKIGRDGTSSFRPDSNEKRGGGFGLGSWFKKPSSERASGPRDDSFGNRERPAGGSSRGGRSGAPRERREGSSFGGGERRSSSFGDRREGSFGGERRSFGGGERRSSGSSFGGGERKPYTEGAPRRSFGSGSRSPSPKKRWQ